MGDEPTGPFNPGFGPDQILPATSYTTTEAHVPVIIRRPQEGPSSCKPMSVYSFVKQTVEKYPTHPALAVKRDGAWKYWSYREYFEESCIVARAFIKLGLEQFHGVCIMGFNSPEWVISNFGAIFAGGLSAGIYTTNSPEACRHLCDNCQAQIILVEDQECLSKILAVKRFLPQLKAIVQWSGVPGGPGVISWAELMAIGKHASEGLLHERMSLAAINQCCTLIYTSGTTGPPKGVMCSQDHMSMVPTIYKTVFVAPEATNALISYLPLSHLAGQMTDIYNAIISASTVYFANRDALKGSLGQTLLEVQPTGFLAVPRIWEKIYEKMQEAGASAGVLKKTVASWAKYHGLNHYMAVREGKDLGAIEKLKHGIATSLLLNKVRAALGLNRARYLVSGAAPLGIDVLEYFMSIGIPILEGYGLSESLSICSLSLFEHGKFKLGSVGKVLPSTEATLIGIGEHRPGEGEICIKGRNVFMGYLGMPEKTEETIDSDGWLHTGDLGKFDEDGFLYITGRLKELVITAGGENIPPVLIEEAIKKETFCISNAMLVGDTRKYLCILLTLKCEMDLDTGCPLEELTPACMQWMRDTGSSASTVKEAIDEVNSNPNGPLSKAISSGIERYNRLHSASNAQKVQKWTLLAHDFSLPTEELNNTLKLKRSFVMEKYKAEIDRMYNDNNFVTGDSKL